MMYPYVKYPDETEVVFSNVYTGENGEECIDVHFERTTKSGFDSVRITLPSYKITVWEGNYTEEEIDKMYEQLNLEKNIRGENLTLEQFAQVAKYLVK